MTARIQEFLDRGSVQGAMMAAAMVVAGGFDALVNIVAGRMLLKEQFAVFIAVVALIQILVNVTNVIRTVVAYYTAEFTAESGGMDRVNTFFHRAWSWSWRWGAVATLAMLLLSPLIARFMKIESSWPLVAAGLALLMLFVRPVTDGTLQGIQNFLGLSSVQVLQSALRLLFAIILIQLGLEAFGAVLALPMATTTALLVAVWFLREFFNRPIKDIDVPGVSLRYSLFTLIGLGAYALLINLDPIVVKRFFSEAIAGDYGTVVTLGKINLFATLGIGMVLFPKATQRQAQGRDPRPVLALALSATIAVGLVLTLIYFLVSGPLVQAVFSGAYNDPGIVLGLVGIATTLYAAINIWLNYALSLQKHSFVVGLAVLVLLVIAAMFIYHPSTTAVATIMIIAGVSGNLLGAATTLREPEAAPSETQSPLF
ncbi:MAG: lipopolysaccharide biosynthesis protein [Candidatus Promineifilaceae bacterium]